MTKKLKKEIEDFLKLLRIIQTSCGNILSFQREERIHVLQNLVETSIITKKQLDTFLKYAEKILYGIDELIS